METDTCKAGGLLPKRCTPLCLPWCHSSFFVSEVFGFTSVLGLHGQLLVEEGLRAWLL